MAEEILSTNAAHAREAALIYNRYLLTPTKMASSTGPNRRRVSEILDLMPPDLPIDSEDSGSVLRHAFVAAKFKPGTDEWQRYAAEVPRIAERRRAMIAVLNGPKNGGIALQDTAGPDFGVNPRTVRRDMARVARNLSYSGNAVFKQLQSNFLSSEEQRRAITAAVQETLHGKEPLISDTSAALVVTVHEMRSKVAPVLQLQEIFVTSFMPLVPRWRRLPFPIKKGLRQIQLGHNPDSRHGFP